MANMHDATDPELLIDDSMVSDLADFKDGRVQTGSDYEALFGALMKGIFLPNFFGPASNAQRQVLMHLLTQSGGPTSYVEICFKVEHYSSKVLFTEDVKYRFSWCSRHAVRKIEDRERIAIEKAVENLMAEGLFESFLTKEFGEHWRSEVRRESRETSAEAEDFESTVEDIVAGINDPDTTIEVEEARLLAAVEAGWLGAKLEITYDPETLAAEEMIVSFDGEHWDWPGQSTRYDCSVSNLPQMAMDAVIEHENLHPDRPDYT
jgi:hypothetical protein